MKNKRVKYTGGPCSLLKFWIWSLTFQKYRDGPCGFALCNALIPNQQNFGFGPNTLQNANHKEHPCTCGKGWGLNALQSENHKNHLCTLRKLGIKSKILVNHRDHPCTLLKIQVDVYIVGLK
ncbi:hypothetical protein Hanom_Chr12g01081301 [Helianthus anomalus]